MHSPGLLLEGALSEGVPFGQTGNGTPLQVVPIVPPRIRTQIDLNAHVMVPTVRYGIMDRWDVSLSIPIVDTLLTSQKL